MAMPRIFEFVERIFRIWVGTAWGKGALALIFGGVLSITSIVQYLIPPVAKLLEVKIAIPETPIWLSLTLVGLGILLLVLSRLIPDRSEQVAPAEPPNPHDTQLLALYRKLITPQLVRFLTLHSFRDAFRNERIQPLEILADDWNTAHYEFIDAEVQDALEEARQLAREFCNLAGDKLFTDDRNPKLLTPLTYVDLGQGITPQTRANIAELNAAARKAAEAFNSFERIARQKIA